MCYILYLETKETRKTRSMLSIKIAALQGDVCIRTNVKLNSVKF